MGTLQEFLNSGKSVKELTTEVAVSKRLSDKNGTPFKFKIKTILADELEEIRSKSTKISIVGKKQEVKMNGHLYTLNTVIEGCVEPNFKDAKSIAERGFRTPAEYVTDVLLPGEIQALAEKIQIFNGYDQSMDELVDEAKN